jgi:hypothetical protein
MSTGSHEDYQRELAFRGPSNRSFGLVLAAAFALLALWPVLRHRPIRWWALAISLFFLVPALVRPALLGRLNRLWMQLGIALGRIVSPVVTGILFFLVFTPIAYLSRRNKDPLRLRFEPDAETYWLHRDPPGPPPESMANQF